MLLLLLRMSLLPHGKKHQRAFKPNIFLWNPIRNYFIFTRKSWSDTVSHNIWGRECHKYHDKWSARTSEPLLGLNAFYSRRHTHWQHILWSASAQESQIGKLNNAAIPHAKRWLQCWLCAPLSKECVFMSSCRREHSGSLSFSRSCSVPVLRQL